MKVVKNICRGLSSGLIALAVSCVAFACMSIIYGLFDLQRRLGLDDDVCWLALLLGPALIVVIHRIFHRRAWAPVVTFTAGLMLTGFGGFIFMSARKAAAQHVSAGPLSGLEHDLAMALGLCILLVALLAISGSVLALVARRIERNEPRFPRNQKEVPLNEI